MASFQNGAVEIAYLDEGAGEPIVLVHGFASTTEVNWVFPGWVVTLTEAGRRVIALDNRGHGASSKLYDPAAYHTTAMTGRCPRAARPSWRRARRHHGLLHGRAHRRVPGASNIRNACARSFSAASASAWCRASACRSASPTPGGAVARRRERPERPQFRSFAEQTRSDLQRARRLHPRLAADAQRANKAPVSACPTLVAVGTNDDVAGSAEELAALIPGARALDIPGRDHMLAVGDKVFKTGVLDFLNQRA